ncbi:hypothetical protein K1T71_008923 [Dendrolimus kikuchii]|uniref:Uncharacterized protein n=1 Tax=Dendrolimus kikuchii TaxID=765133 RepID=A0ACC1CW98_9NEOP|nr:hypothetical protein K1T71_008923 [Dendrolimus kikuchii]
MDSTSIVERIIRSLSFEVEAIPQDTIKISSSSKTTPMNVKIRVRKKNEAFLQEGVMTIAKQINTDNNPQRVRLVSSDQTIMSFNVYVESEKEKIPPKKPKKHIFNVLKPGLCLSNVKDEDDYQYVPSQPPIPNVPNTDSVTQSELMQHFSLRKGNLGNIDEAATLPSRETYFLGKCKPGGCLDPPFGEDIYTYKPTTKSKSPLKHGKNNINLDMKESVNSKRSSTSERSHLKENKNQNEESLLTNKASKIVPGLNEVFKLYQTHSMTYSNSIITYPSTVNASFEQLQENKNYKRKTLSEDISKKSFNEFTELFFHPKQEIENMIFPNLETQKNSNNMHIDSDTISNKKCNDIDDVQEKSEVKQHCNEINITEATSIRASTQDIVANSLKESQNDFIKGFGNIEIQTANRINRCSNSIEQDTSLMIINNEIFKIVNSSNLHLKQYSNIKISESQEESSQPKRLNHKNIDSNDHLIELNSSKTNTERDNKANVACMNLPQQSIVFSWDNSDIKSITRSETNKSNELKRITSLNDNKDFQENTIKINETNSVSDNNEINSEDKLSDTYRTDETYLILDKKESPLALKENNLNIFNYEIKDIGQKLSQDISRGNQDLKQDVNIKRDSSYSCDALQNKTVGLVENVSILYNTNLESNYDDNISHIRESEKNINKHSIKSLLTENCPRKCDSLILSQGYKSNLTIKEYESKPSKIKSIELGETDLEQSQFSHKKDEYETNIKNKTINIRNQDIESEYEVRDPTNLSNYAISSASDTEYIKVNELYLNMNEKVSSDTTQEKKLDIDQDDIQVRDEVTFLHQNIATTDEIITINQNCNSISKIKIVSHDNASIEYGAISITDKSIINTDKINVSLENKSGITENRGIEISKIIKNANKKADVIRRNSSIRNHNDSQIFDIVNGNDLNHNASEKQSIVSNSKISEHTGNINTHDIIQKEYYANIKGDDNMTDNTFINVTENISTISSKLTIIQTEIGEIFRSDNLKKNIDTVNEINSKDQTDTKKENACSNNEYYTHDDKEKIQIFSDELIETTYANLKNITEVAASFITNKDEHATEIIKDKISRNNLNTMFTNATEYENQLSHENISVEVSKDEEAKPRVSYDILNKINYSSSKTPLPTGDLPSSKSAIRCLLENTQVSNSQILESVSFPQDFTIERENTFSELKVQGKERPSAITNSKIEINYNSDSLHKKQILDNRDKINNEFRNMALPEKPSLRSQPTASIIPNILPLKLFSNVTANNFNLFDKTAKLELKSYFEPSKDNNDSKMLIKPPIQDTSHSQGMTVQEKIKSFTKHFSVGASILPTNIVNNTKSPITVNLGFQSYINNNNERIFKTIDVDKEAERFPHDIVTIVKSRIRLPSKEIRIPIDEDNDISFNIINPNSSTQHNSDTVNHTRKFKHDLNNKRKAEVVNKSIKDIQRKTTNEKSDNKVIDDNLIAIYEKELIPLRKVFKDLKDEIDSLARQKPIIRDKLQRPVKYKPSRLISVNRRCGCLKE